MKNNGFRMFLAGSILMGVSLIISRGVRYGTDTWQMYLNMFAMGFAFAALLFWQPRNHFPPAVFFRALLSGGKESENEDALTLESLEPIKGEMAIRLKRCIATFPIKYPDYRTRRPKLDSDIRPWIKEEVGASEREAHVFGTMIAEHFDLSSDTQKGE